MARAFAAVFLAPVLLVGASSAFAQNRLVDARARIDATRDEVVRVEIDYRIEIDGTERAAPLEGLVFRPTSIEGARATVGGVVAPLVLGSAGARTTGTVELPSDRPGVHTLRVAYDVLGAWSGDDPRRLRVPLLALSWPSEEALPGVFEAEALLPEGWTAYESFPSGLTAAGAALGAARYTLELPAAPALLSMRASESSVRFGGFTGVLDGLVLLTLVVLAGVGWHHFRTDPEAA